MAGAARRSKGKSNKSTSRTLIAIVVALCGIFLFAILAPGGEVRDEEVSLAPKDSTAVREATRKGRALFEMGKLPESIDAYKSALELNPRSAAAGLGMAISLEQLAQKGMAKDIPATYKEAARIYEAVIEIGGAEVAIAHNNLGNLQREQFSNLTAAHYHLNRSITVYESEKAKGREIKEFFYPYKGMGSLMEKTGNVEKAIEYFEKSLKIKEDSGLEIYKDLLLPYIYQSLDDMNTWRQRFLNNVENIIKKDLKVQNTATMEGVPQYYLAYHGVNNVEANKLCAKMMLKINPALSFTAPHIPSYKKGGKKFKVGFVSHYMRDHSVGKMILGLLRHLHRSKLSITIFNLGAEDNMTEMLKKHADKYIKLQPGEISAARNTISFERLDALVFPEIGMDPNAYSISFARLAPVQLAMHGHADTTGVPTIDYYVTYEGFSEPAVQKKYSERVLRLEGHSPLLLNYDIVPFKAESFLSDATARSDLRELYGIPPSAFVFACLQTLFKLTPHMDGAFKSILTQNPNAVILLKELPMNDQVGKYLMQRLTTTLGPELVRRVIMLPPLGSKEYQNIFAIVDVVLDSYPFGGHTSTMDALSNDVPVVTLPNDLLSGRFSQGVLTALEATDLIAKDKEDYARIATKLATDSAFLADARSRIKAKLPALIKDTESVKSWERMLTAAISGGSLQHFLV